jgi:hypothetical protein
MTNQDDDDRLLTDHPLLVVEALLDGERVDPGALRAALAEAAGRDHFVELLMLREAVSAVGPYHWSAARDTRAARWPPGSTLSPRQHTVAGRGVKWSAAAAALLISITTGYLAGQRLTASESAPANIEAVVSVDTAPVAPAPTRVITLQPGVNWTDTSGGQ